jgi:hypothetical protein
LRKVMIATVCQSLWRAGRATDTGFEGSEVWHFLHEWDVNVSVVALKLSWV